jgi:tetratricopeptide (TPR) repeat protein
MNLLPLQEQRHLDAAEGWLELGNWLEANEELEQICPSLRAHPSVLFMRFEVYSKAKKWDGAAEIACTLAMLLPERPEAWISWAYSTRRRSENGVVEAKRILLEAAAKFPASHWICYNLGCYELQLGNMEATDLWLKRAFELDKANEIKLAALENDDFQPLWWKKGEI